MSRWDGSQTRVVHFGDDSYNTSYARSGSLLGPYTLAAVVVSAALIATQPAHAAADGTFRNPLGPAAEPFVTHHDGQYYVVEPRT